LKKSKKTIKSNLPITEKNPAAQQLSRDFFWKKAQPSCKLLQIKPCLRISVFDFPPSPGKSKKRSSVTSVPRATCRVEARRAKPEAGGKKIIKPRSQPHSIAWIISIAEGLKG
jgi:hypothetical protein